MLLSCGHPPLRLSHLTTRPKMPSSLDWVPAPCAHLSAFLGFVSYRHPFFWLDPNYSELLPHLTS